MSPEVLRYLHSFADLLVDWRKKAVLNSDPKALIVRFTTILIEREGAIDVDDLATGTFVTCISLCGAHDAMVTVLFTGCLIGMH